MKSSRDDDEDRFVLILHVEKENQVLDYIIIEEETYQKIIEEEEKNNDDASQIFKWQCVGLVKQNVSFTCGSSRISLTLERMIISTLN